MAIRRDGIMKKSDAARVTRTPDLRLAEAREGSGEGGDIPA
jgi:hypothetical protein